VKSLQRQLHLWLAAGLVVLMAIMWVVGNHAIRSLTEDFAASRLAHDGESLVAALDFHPDSSTRLRWRRLSQVYSQPYSGHYYVILVANEPSPIYSRSLWNNTLEIPMLAIGRSEKLHMDGPADQTLLVWVKGFQKQGVHFTLAVAEDLTSINAQQSRFRKYFALLAVAGLIALLSVQGIVVRRAVRTLNPVRQDIKRLSNGETGVLSERVPVEILPLVQEINHLLQLLSRRVERSRNSLGNLSHALKGPLNYLLHYFDKHGSDAVTTADPQAKQQLARIEQLLERELKRARLVGKGISGQRFDAARELPDLVSVLRQVYAHRGLLIEYDIGSDIPPFGDREDIMELVGNLLDNACKWARGSVRCSVSDNGAYRIVVEDDGLGVSQRDIDSLGQRGTRLDETVAGHGLGLAIVRNIVELYEGELAFFRAESLEGLKVVVTLPH
jgi:signal transduction histidine kinase